MSKAIYGEAIEEIEKRSSTIKFIFVTATVYTLMTINFIATMFAYFTTGLDGYDYQFVYPMW